MCLKFHHLDNIQPIWLGFILSCFFSANSELLGLESVLQFVFHLTKGIDTLHVNLCDERISEGLPEKNAKM